jgi:hypothetical protein
MSFPVRKSLYLKFFDFHKLLLTHGKSSKIIDGYIIKPEVIKVPGNRIFLK